MTRHSFFVQLFSADIFRRDGDTDILLKEKDIDGIQ